jgi:hypothetical protein
MRGAAGLLPVIPLQWPRTSPARRLKRTNSRKRPERDHQALPLTRGRRGTPALADGGEILRKMARAGTAQWAGSQMKLPGSQGRIEARAASASARSRQVKRIRPARNHARDGRHRPPARVRWSFMRVREEWGLSSAKPGRGSGPIMLARRFNGGCRRTTGIGPRQRSHNAFRLESSARAAGGSPPSPTRSASSSSATSCARRSTARLPLTPGDRAALFPSLCGIASAPRLHPDGGAPRARELALGDRCRGQATLRDQA